MVAGGGDDVLAGDREGLVARHQVAAAIGHDAAGDAPLARRRARRRRPGPADDLDAALAGAARHRLGDVGRVYVAVGRVEDRALQVLGADQRPAFADLAGRQPFEGDADRLGGGGVKHVLVHAGLRLRHAQVADDREAGVQARLRLQRLVELHRVVVDVAGGVAHVEQRQEPGGVPGAAARSVRRARAGPSVPAGLRQVIGDRRSRRRRRRPPPRAHGSSSLCPLWPIPGRHSPGGAAGGVEGLRPRPGKIPTPGRMENGPDDGAAVAAGLAPGRSCRRRLRQRVVDDHHDRVVVGATSTRWFAGGDPMQLPGLSVGRSPSLAGHRLRRRVRGQLVARNDLGIDAVRQVLRGLVGRGLAEGLLGAVDDLALDLELVGHFLVVDDGRLALLDVGCGRARGETVGGHRTEEQGGKNRALHLRSPLDQRPAARRIDETPPGALTRGRRDLLWAQRIGAGMVSGKSVIRSRAIDALLSRSQPTRRLCRDPRPSEQACTRASLVSHWKCGRFFAVLFRYTRQLPLHELGDGSRPRPQVPNGSGGEADQTKSPVFSKRRTSMRPRSEMRSSGMTTSASSECCMKALFSPQPQARMAAIRRPARFGDVASGRVRVISPAIGSSISASSSPSRQRRDAAADLGQPVGGAGHVGLGGADDDHVVAVMRHRRGQRAGHVVAEARDEAVRDVAGRPVPLDERELADVLRRVHLDEAVLQPAARPPARGSAPGSRRRR